jgi:pilus assembly protein CpaF
VAKLCTLPLLAGANISAEFVNPTVGSCIDYVVHCQMLPSGARRVQEIAKVSWDPIEACLRVTEVKL